MKSKLGLHVNGLWGEVDGWVARARPQVLVSLDHNPDHWRSLCDLSPNTLIIGRYMGYNDGDPEVYPADGDTPAVAAQKAERFFSQMKPEVEKMRGLYDAWVGINEPVCHTLEHAQNLSAWFARWGDSMKTLSVLSVAYTFSQGVPEDWHWPILAEGLQHCDLLGLHEYWCPHLYSPDQVPYHALRYRVAWNKLPPEARRQFVITECGADGGAGNRPTDGWQGLGLSEDAYLQDLQQYDAELQKDDYVIGATIFSAGAGWAHWDITEARSIPVYIGSTGDPVPVKVGVSLPPPPLSLRDALLAAAQAHQVIQFNNQAALQKSIFADGFVPNSSEFQLVSGAAKYVAQRAEHLGSGRVRVYFCPTTDYRRVRFVERGTSTPEIDPVLCDALLKAAQARQVIQFNNQAALQKQMLADRFCPNSGEFQVTSDGAAYIGQRAEHLATGRVRVYYCATSNFGLVKIVER